MKHSTKQSLDDDKQLPHLPEHLIVENILARLPVKSLLRFKSVCKSWLSTIPSREFVESHRKFLSHPTKYLLFLGNDDDHHHHRSRRVVSLSVDDGECSSPSVTELVNFELEYKNGENNLYVVGSADSLICLHDERYRFSLWNPTTRSNYYISSPAYDISDETIIAVGFGYVSSINDFRIACLTSSPDHVDLVNLYLYSVSSAKWDKIAGLGHDGSRIARGESGAVMIDDTLYWPPVVDQRLMNPVVGVNLVDGQLSKVTLSSSSFDKPVGDGGIVMKLVRIRGRLACCYYRAQGNTEAQVWMLMRNGVRWMKVYEILLYKYKNMKWLHLGENDKSLILKNSHLMLLDPSQIFLKKFDCGTFFDDGLCISKALEYKESLLSPEFWN